MTEHTSTATVQRRCYRCDVAPAWYEAKLDHDCTPVVLLCRDCAIAEREWNAVAWIRTLRSELTQP